MKIPGYWEKHIIAVWCARIMLFIPLHGMVTMLYFIKLIKVFYAKEWVQAHSLILCLKYDRQGGGCMAAKNIEEAVELIARDLLAGQDIIELVDVEYVKEHKDWYLRVSIDKAGGIDIEDCQELSEKLEAELDAKDVIPDSYILEVSSPGIDRVLRKPRDLVREQGKAVDVTLYAPLDGKKMLTGVLTDFDGEVLTLDGVQKIELSKAAQIRLHIDF